MIGDAVNVAHRLCAEAGRGEILVSEALCQVVKDQADYEYLPQRSRRLGLRTAKSRAVEV